MTNKEASSNPSDSNSGSYSEKIYLTIPPASLYLSKLHGIIFNYGHNCSAIYPGIPELIPYFLAS